MALLLGAGGQEPSAGLGWEFLELGESFTGRYGAPLKGFGVDVRQV